MNRLAIVIVAAGLAVANNVHAGGFALSEQSATVPVTASARNCRFVYKAWLPFKDVAVKVSSSKGKVELSDLTVYLHTEKTTRIRRGVFAGERHKGGVTFAVLQ